MKETSTDVVSMLNVTTVLVVMSVHVWKDTAVMDLTAVVSHPTVCIGTHFYNSLQIWMSVRLWTSVGLEACARTLMVATSVCVLMAMTL